MTKVGDKAERRAFPFQCQCGAKARTHDELDRHCVDAAHSHGTSIRRGQY